MRLAPTLAALVCLVVTGCAGTAATATPTRSPNAALAGRALAKPAITALPQAVAPTPPTAPTATPRPAGQIDAAARSECGVPDGTVRATGEQIVISLACQELSAYQDGVPVLSTAVTTGRPALPTPTGHFSVLSRNSPYRMVSSWPRGTIGWYAPSWVTWVLWFRADGYGIHDASWRGAYGPGTQADGSHGCVNVPHDAMRQLYAWAATGATVDIV